MPGVVIKMLREGTGEAVNRGDKVFVFYRGTFAATREVFDSNLSAKDPLAFTAGSYDVIQALSEGSIGLHVGSTFVMIVPPEFGFGEAGVPGFIPPKSTLIFEIVIVGRNELKYKETEAEPEPAAAPVKEEPVVEEEPIVEEEPVVEETPVEVVVEAPEPESQEPEAEPVDDTYRKHRVQETELTVTEEPEPVVEEQPAPVVEEEPESTPAPVEETPAPVEEASAPVEETPAPVEETAAPEPVVVEEPVEPEPV